MRFDERSKFRPHAPQMTPGVLHGNEHIVRLPGKPRYEVEVVHTDRIEVSRQDLMEARSIKVRPTGNEEAVAQKAELDEGILPWEALRNGRAYLLLSDGWTDLLDNESVRLKIESQGHCIPFY